MLALAFCILLGVCVILFCHVHKLRCRLDAICNIADEFLADLDETQHG